MKSAYLMTATAALGAGLLLGAAPVVSANPYSVTDDEVAWGDANGQVMVCEVFGASPDADGLGHVVMSVMDEGWDQVAAGRVIGYSLGTYCPELLGAWVDATNDLE